MKVIINIGRAFYAMAIIIYLFQQFYFGTFQDVSLSVYRNDLPLLRILAYVFGAYLVRTGILNFRPFRGRKAALLLGSLWIGLFLGTHISYELISEPNILFHLALLTTHVKELALAGAALIVAGSFKTDKLVLTIQSLKGVNL